MLEVQPSIGAEGQGPPGGNMTDLRLPVIVLHHDGAWIKGELNHHRCELSSAYIESIHRPGCTATQALETWNSEPLDRAIFNVDNVEKANCSVLTRSSG